MDGDRLIGAGILIVVIVAAIVYFGLFFLGFGFEVVAAVVSIGFLIVLGIGGWIGWTMASTPAPEPLELEEVEEAPEMGPGGEAFRGELTAIPGMTGPRVQALIDAGFDNFDSIRGASEEELTQAKGIGPKLAGEIKDRVEEWS